MLFFALSGSDRGAHTSYRASTATCIASYLLITQKTNGRGLEGGDSQIRYVNRSTAPQPWY